MYFENNNSFTSYHQDVMNEAFIASFNEELDEDFKSLSIAPDSDISVSKFQKIGKEGVQIASAEPTDEVFEPITSRKFSFCNNFEFPSSGTSENSRSFETNKLLVSRPSSEICTRFSPLEDISNIKLKQSSNNEVFTTTSKLSDISTRKQIPQHSKENFHVIPSFTKIKNTMEEIRVKGRKESKQPFKKLKCTKSIQRTNTQLRTRIPALIRGNGIKSPSLKSKEYNLAVTPQTPVSSSKKLVFKPMFGSKFFTPTTNAKRLANQRSLQLEHDLREDRFLAEQKHRTRDSTPIRKSKDTNLKVECKISGHAKDTSNFEKSHSNTTPVQPGRQRSIEKCFNFLSVSQNKKIDALAKEPGILEETDLTLCANTPLFSPTYEVKFEFPK